MRSVLSNGVMDGSQLITPWHFDLRPAEPLIFAIICFPKDKAVSTIALSTESNLDENPYTLSTLVTVKNEYLLSF